MSSKYLAEELKLDVNCKNNNNYNGFLLACNSENNLDVIKYLAEELKLNINAKNNNNYNGFLLACNNKNNLDVIKYFTEVPKIDIYCKNKYNDNGFLLACNNRNNSDAIRYLAKYEEIKIIDNIHNYLNINILDSYDKKHLQYINKLLTYDYLKSKSLNNEIKNPYEYKFKGYKSLVDKLPRNLKIYNITL